MNRKWERDQADPISGPDFRTRFPPDFRHPISADPISATRFSACKWERDQADPISTRFPPRFPDPISHFPVNLVPQFWGSLQFRVSLFSHQSRVSVSGFSTAAIANTASRRGGPPPKAAPSPPATTPVTASPPTPMARTTKCSSKTTRPAITKASPIARNGNPSPPSKTTSSTACHAPLARRRALRLQQSLFDLQTNEVSEVKKFELYRR
jgi:hypothetical protein